MSDFHIPPDWLESVRGTVFFYPAAYEDHQEPLAVFRDVIDEFWFADINYPAGLRMTSAVDGCEEFRLKSNETSAPVSAVMENLDVDCSDFHLYCLRSVFESGGSAIFLRRQLD